MKLLLAFVFPFLSFLATQVLADSELVHAWERIFFYTNYRLEELLFPGENDGFYMIAQDCKTVLGRRCNFNEFVEYISGGKPRTAPRYITTDELDYKNKQQVEAAVAAIERAPIASTDLVPGRVFRKNGDQNKGFVDLYRKVQNFWRDCERDIATDEGRARLTEAKTIMAQMIGIVRGLREGPTAAIRTKALAILFPNTNIYDVYLDTATNKRYDPIVWVTRDVTVSTKTFTLVDWAATNAKNPQLMEPFMSAQLKERMTWFNTDDERGGARRANDGRNPDVRNHLSVVEAVKECQACLIAPAT